MKIYNIIKASINFPRMLFPMSAYFLSKNKEIINSDILQSSKTHSWIILYKKLLNDKAYRRLFYYRFNNDNKFSRLLVSISKSIVPPLYTFGIDTEYIGKRMMVYHGYSTIVHAKSIGDNFSVYQQVTIEKGRIINGNNIPVIGNNVTVYAGAIIIGGIKIGDNVIIGAGTVVNKDVPAGSTVVGSEMRIINNQ